MKMFTVNSNGHTLAITVDGDALRKEIDGRIEYYKSDKVEEYERQRVYGDYKTDFCTLDETLKDLEDFKKVITDYENGDGQELFSLMPIKKNGTFKKNVKPTLKEAVCGIYYEECYGWSTMILRLEAVSDTEVRMALSQVILHY